MKIVAARTSEVGFIAIYPHLTNEAAEIQYASFKEHLITQFPNAQVRERHTAHSSEFCITDTGVFVAIQERVVCI